MSLDHWASWPSFMEEAAENSKGSLTCPRPPTIPGGGPRIPSGALYADLVWSPYHTYSPPSNPIPRPRRGTTLAKSPWGDPGWLICFPRYHLWVWMRLQGKLKDRHSLGPGGSLFIGGLLFFTLHCWLGVGLGRRLIGVSSAALGGSERYVGEEFPVAAQGSHSNPSPRPSQRFVAPELPREAWRLGFR